VKYLFLAACLALTACGDSSPGLRTVGVVESATVIANRDFAICTVRYTVAHEAPNRSGRPTNHVGEVSLGERNFLTCRALKAGDNIPVRETETSTWIDWAHV
jgi:hypothetical protein